MSGYNTLMGDLRSSLNQETVDYVEIATKIAAAGLPIEELTEKVAPLFWDLFEKVGFRSYKFHQNNEWDSAWETCHLRRGSVSNDQQEATRFTDLLLHGFAQGGGYEAGGWGGGDTVLFPTNALMDVDQIYWIKANYDSGSTFEDEPNQTKIFALIQGQKQMRRYMEMLEARNPNRMSPASPQDPDYQLKTLLHLNYMMCWEGYFERLNWFEVGIIGSIHD